MVIPHASYSAMAGNPLIISPDRLKDEGLAGRTRLTYQRFQWKGGF